jgi:predicted RNA binding protein YcfA (HicA-like mRNA interferase family)
MSPRFPDANYRQVAKVAKSLGFSLFRAGKGSHEIWKRNSDNRFTTIPNHGKTSLKRKTLKAILLDLQISPEDFLKIR